MPAYVAEIYFQEIDRIKSTENIDALKVSAFPHMENSARSEMSSSFEERAKWQEDEVITSTRELAQILGGSHGR